jgi:hypothetical protein
MSDMHTRAGRNQVLFREINERIREIGDVQRVPADEPWDFLCECADEACTETVSLTVAEYEHIRSSPTRFPIKPGHELPEVEAVVDRRESYIVVEKEAEAAELARANDPRAGDAGPVT